MTAVRSFHANVRFGHSSRTNVTFAQNVGRLVGGMHE